MRKGAPRAAINGNRVGVARSPDPVKPIVATLSADPAARAAARAEVEAVLGPVDRCSGPVPFEATTYYAAEMGPHLEREFWAFERLASPEDLAGWKLATNAIEARLRGPGGRTVNLDPGYVNFPHVALASTKAFSHRLYLRDGVYAEVTLLWRGHGFVTLPWTFPEYRTSPVQAFLMEVRAAYATAVRSAPVS